ncbi:MAG: SPW repeat protein [Anaerolineae bacterium]
MLLGAWLLASPWLLGFSHQTVATDNIMIVGLVVVVMSLWSMARRAMPQQVTT